jgi:predicted phosphodiesterase
MRTLIFSDTHLTHDYSPSLDALLRSLIEKADQVIVNGDFWDAFHTDWDSFARSRWQELFSLLRKKKAIVIWGNHDLPRWTKDPALLGAQYLERFTLPLGNKELLIEHGHLLAPSFDTRHPFLAWNFSRYVPYRKFSFKPNSWINQKADLILRQAASQLNNNQILITGHSHVAVLDGEAKYVNSGIMGNGHASWLWIEDGRISLQRSSYGY